MPNTVVNARWRLAFLGCSQSAHFMATYCLRVYVVLRMASEGAAQRDTAWHIVSALFMLPSIVLVPVYGALGNTLPKRAALVGAAAYCVAIMALFAAWGQGWLACVACVALGSALYTPTRHALLPAAAQDCHFSLPRVVSAIESTAVTSIVAGMVLGGALMPLRWDRVASALSLPEQWATALTEFGLAVPVVVIIGLMLFSLLTAIPARFDSDIRRAESPWDALRGFFRDAYRLLRLGDTRFSLLAICILRGIVTAAAGALIADSLAHNTDLSGQYQVLIVIAVLTMLGAAVGSFLAGLLGDRSLALVPFGATGLTLALAAVAMFPPVPAWLCILVGVCGGIINVPLLAMYQATVPADARGNGMAILNTAGFVSMTAISIVMAALARGEILTATGQVWFVAILGGISATAAWWTLGSSTVGLLLRLPKRSGTVGDDPRAIQTMCPSKSPE
jgi:MFS family permease